MKWTRRFACSLLVAACAWITGCEAEEPSGSPVSTGQEEIRERMFEAPAQVFVLVVDDADTPEAAELRAHALESVESGLWNARNTRWEHCGSRDPAAWHPGDNRVVIARPSAPDDLVLFTSVQSPPLAWVTQTSLEEEIAPVVSATKSALADRLAQPGDTYRPLRAARRALDLLSGSRVPETPEEKSFVETLPEDMFVQLLMVSPRDDEDGASVEQLLPSAESRELMLYPWVVGPFGSDPSSYCEISPPGGASRLGIWGKALDANFGTWPCDGKYFWDNLLAAFAVDCGPRCHSRPIVIDEEGNAACRFFIEKEDLGPCDPERGWFDPEGLPEIVTVGGVDLRRCEIRQLTGASLEACRGTLECSGCGSGFCATEVPELDESEYCPNDFYWPLRFVGGALDAPGEVFSGVCLTESAP